MSVATANSYSLVRFGKPVGEFWFEIPPVDSRLDVPSEPLPSDNRLDAIVGPSPIAAGWISTIERRILGSVAPSEVEQGAEEGRWLNMDIAGQAISFFQSVSDVLPATEPYLYASLQGDLVAEFNAPRGKITNIVGKTSVLAFVATEGTVVKTTLALPIENVRQARQEFQRLTDHVQLGKHSSVET